MHPRDFPPLLREIADPPASLYIRGTLPGTNSGRSASQTPNQSPVAEPATPEAFAQGSPEIVYLCVVGSRSASPYGRRMTQKLIAGLRGYPVAIVSGMAIGIDSEAHKAALEVGVPTVAVLPSGLSDGVIYPRQNRTLAQQILKSGGALISENEPDFKAALYSFAQRNRIAAGMSKATLIVEAGEKSGTLITARLALNYNREVLCVPHELGRESGAGVNTLIREGATLVRDSNDILEALGFKVEEKPEQQTLPTDLNESEVKIMTTLTEAMTRDDLIDAAELSAQDANIGLSSLLIRGLIVERLGKIERI
ncbi:MAG TPA: DNA-processing protein DprA [Candidatus Paceibacterota bacterium]|nr:DNA-processing protein DprA [Candidatus Paceibacterota bacterium]